MSQRLHIGETTKTFYDCVIDSSKGVREKLKSDWLMCDGGMFVGPWKIRIGDYDLWNKVEPVVAGVMAECGKQYPDCVWTFYDGNRSIEHPTKAELDAWLFRPRNIETV